MQPFAQFTKHSHSKQLPATIVQETEHTIAIEDLHPQAKTHILVLPKQPYANFAHFTQQSTPSEQSDFLATINSIASKQSKGGKIMINLGNRQEIPHLHAHIMLD